MRFISDTFEFEVLMQNINTLITKNPIVPDNVYEKKYENFFYFETDFCLTSSFLELLLDLSSISQDRSFFYGVLDPDPTNYFFLILKNFPSLNFL